MEKEIREIFTKVEFDCDSWNTNVIETKEYNKRKDDSVAKLTTLLKAKMLEILLDDSIAITCQSLKQYREMLIAELRKKVEGI